MRIAELWKGFQPGHRRLVMITEPSDGERTALESVATGEYVVVAPDTPGSGMSGVDRECRSWKPDVIWASGAWLGDVLTKPVYGPLVVDAPSIAARLLRSEILAHATMMTTPGEVQRMSFKLATAWKRLRAERNAWALADLVTPCSPYELAHLPRDVKRMSRAVPNGATLLPFRPAQPERPRLLFVGTLHYPPNAEAAALLSERIFPRILTHRPDATLDIVGAGPDPILMRIKRHPGVTVHGFVEDLSGLYTRASLVVVPLRRHTGTNLKILEAIAHSVPVVTTPIGLEGLADLVPGRDVEVARSWKDCADAVVELLDDPPQAQAIARSAWHTLESKLTWDASRHALMAGIQSIL